MEIANLVVFLVLLLVAFFVGEWLERSHVQSIRRREQLWQRMPAITFRRVPEAWNVADAGMVMGSTVVSVDYFKRFLAGLRFLVGGRVRSYELLLDRARREAVLRLKKQAMDLGYHAVVNVRLETSRLANGRGSEGTAGVEILAFGTGLKLQQPAA